MSKGARGTAIAIAALFALHIGLNSARADLAGSTFESEEWRVSLTGPKGWKLSDDTSYPSILLWMVHRRPDARMLFSAELLVDVKDAQAYANRTAERLKKLGFNVRAPQLHSATGAYWMDFDDGKHFLRQALLVPGQLGIGYSLTLSAPEMRARGQLLRAFDDTLRSIVPVRTKQDASAKSAL
jgi:hypothetical protein